MNGTFLRFSIWYIILGLICIVVTSLTVAKSRDWKQTLAFYFFTVGVTFYIEWPILIIFHGYDYYPALMKVPFDNSMLGNVFSQTIISASALLIAVNDLSFFWFFIFSSSYALIEFLFLKLGIYEHHWYSTWYTLLGLIPYYWVIKILYKKIMFSPSPIYRHLALYLSTFAIYCPAVEWMLRIFGIYRFKPGILPDLVRDHVNAYVIYIFLMLNFIVISYQAKMRWWLKVTTILAVYLTNYILVKADILYVKTGWLLFCTLTVTVLNYLLVALLNGMFGFRTAKSGV